MKVIFDRVTRRDARLLVRWWNSHTRWHHEVRKQPHPKARYYQVVRL